MPVERLQKVLGAAGVASRRASEALIAAGRVTVDGRTATVGESVDPAASVILVDGRPIASTLPAHVHLVLHKPIGATSTVRDRHAARTVLDLIPSGLVPAGTRLYPVGRLDSDSEGLLLLTNDGAWAERVLHPRFGHEREYEVDVEPEPTVEQLAALRRGVPLEEGLGKISALRVAAPGRLRLVLRTGWKRQVRRMCAAVGLRVTRLRRVRMGPLTLGALPLGKWRELTKREVAALRVAR